MMKQVWLNAIRGKRSPSTRYCLAIASATPRSFSSSWLLAWLAAAMQHCPPGWEGRAAAGGRRSSWLAACRRLAADKQVRGGGARLRRRCEM
jgi:hypothetical protein